MVMAGQAKRDANSQAAQQISSQSRVVVLYLFLHRRPGKAAEPIVDLFNRGVSVVGIAAREAVTAKRSRPEMAPQRLEKIESAPGNGMVPEASNPQNLVHGREAGRARLRLTSNDRHPCFGGPLDGVPRPRAEIFRAASS